MSYCLEMQLKSFILAQFHPTNSIFAHVQDIFQTIWYTIINQPYWTSQKESSPQLVHCYSYVPLL